MMAHQIQLTVPQHFVLRNVVQAHGWRTLAPFRWNEATEVIATAAALDNRPTDIFISQPSLNNILIQWTGSIDQQTIIETATRMLMLNIDFNEFHQRCKEHKGLEHVAEQGLGGMLRSPSIWEDVVKVLCTTNVNWRGTQNMAERLTGFFGDRTPCGYRCFPSPARIFQEDRPTLIRQSKMGYRAELLAKISRDVVEDNLDLSAWEQIDASTKEIRREILGLKGFGPYAAASILALVNRYDFLPVDSVFMTHVSRLHFNDQRPTHNQAEDIYNQWDRWKYLAYWFER